MKTVTERFSLNGKTALITGSYRGLGATIARGLAEAGARVVLNGRSADGVEAAAKALRDAGHDAMGVPFDVTDEASVKWGIHQIAKEWGSVDILVNNAGIQRRHKLEEMPVEEFRLVIETNLTAAFIAAKAVAPAMIAAKSGKIINMCSLMTDLARPTTGNYAAAKGGLRMLARAMTAEWAQYNIQANGIAPGYFETDMTRKLKEDPEFNSWICGRTPSGRWGNPEELQGLGVFLASEASTYINGQVIFVDGGMSAVV
jgi:gluconate 5-dehydrogenase